ncbi:hypothetical protein AKO1_013494 [Acrasis kona]|uniref:Uncharacterized protein n=1 Tax=Acrasis kona TaxID=1008807 RepID=A0AAW2YKM8_9EUKA
MPNVLNCGKTSHSWCVTQEVLVAEIQINAPRQQIFEYLSVPTQFEKLNVNWYAMIVDVINHESSDPNVLKFTLVEDIPITLFTKRVESEIEMVLVKYESMYEKVTNDTGIYVEVFLDFIENRKDANTTTIKHKITIDGGYLLRKISASITKGVQVKWLEDCKLLFEKTLKAVN